MIKKILKTVNRLKGYIFKNKELILLDIGHSEESKGAYNFNADLYEYEFNVVLTNRILELYKTKSIAVKNDIIKLTDVFSLDTISREGSLTKEVLTINKLKPKCVISFHCNAFNKKASGSEVLIKQGDDISKNIAKLFLESIVKLLKISNRGIKEIQPEDRGGYFLYNISSPVVILEPFFIDNDRDLDIVTDKFNTLAYNYLCNIVSMITKEPDVVLL